MDYDVNHGSIFLMGQGTISKRTKRSLLIFMRLKHEAINLAVALDRHMGVLLLNKDSKNDKKRTIRLFSFFISEKIMHNKNIYRILRFAATLIFLALLWPYIDVVFISLTVVYFFRWIFLFFHKRTKTFLAHLMTHFLIFLSVFIPLSLFGWLTSIKSVDLFHEKLDYFDENAEDIFEKLNNIGEMELWDKLYSFLIEPNLFNIYYDPGLTEKELDYEEFSVAYSLTQRELGYPLIEEINKQNADLDEIFAPYEDEIIYYEEQTDMFISREQSLIKRTISKISKHIPYYLSAFFVYLFLVTYLFENADRLLRNIIEVLPLKKEITQSYVRKIWLTLGSLMKGVLLVSLLQWILIGVSFQLIGVKQFVLITLFSTILFIISVWPGIFVIPFCLYLILSGSRIAWIILFIVTTCIGMLDNILKTRLLHEEVKIESSLLLIATFSGVIFWWAKGIFYWPILMSVALSTYEILKTYDN